jgi:hypothetical protein
MNQRRKVRIACTTAEAKRNPFRFLPSPFQALQGSAIFLGFPGVNRLDKNESTRLSFEGEGIDTA